VQHANPCFSVYDNRAVKLLLGLLVHFAKDLHEILTLLTDKLWLLGATKFL